MKNERLLIEIEEFCIQNDELFRPMIGELAALGLDHMWVAVGFGSNGVMTGPYGGRLVGEGEHASALYTHTVSPPSLSTHTHTQYTPHHARYQ